MRAFFWHTLKKKRPGDRKFKCKLCVGRDLKEHQGSWPVTEDDYQINWYNEYGKESEEKEKQKENDWLMKNYVAEKEEEEDKEKQMIENDPINGAKAIMGWYEETVAGKKIDTNNEKMKSLDFPSVPPVGYEVYTNKCGDGKSFREYGDEPLKESPATRGDHVLLRMRKRG